MEEEGPPEKPSKAPLQMLSKDVHQWTVEEVGDWMRTVHSNKPNGINCSDHTAEDFIWQLRTNDINGEALIALTEKNLKEDLYLSPLGEVKRVMQAIRRLANNCNKAEDIHPYFFNNSSQSSSPHHSPITHHHHYYKSVKNHHDLDAYSPLTDDKCGDRDTAKSSFSHSGSQNSHRKEKRMSARRYYSSDSDNEDSDVPMTQDDITDGELLIEQRTKRRLRGSTSLHKQYTFGKRTPGTTSNGRASAKLQPEYLKTAISCFYMFMSTWVTAIVMVFVHDRVPDRDRHPPLPDIFLDNVPHIPWAFQLCEVTILIMTATLAVILSLHKHRCIILRRFAALSGTVFLLRCATMFITSLSVPGDHLQCSPREQKSIWNQIEQAWIIWQGGGLSIKGVRTCGDYMFSGHTTALTMLNFFITEYTPRRMYFVHISSWVLNMFGVFFVLAAHEHYSIDVFIAFYITSRMFLYYHSLANNRALHQRDSFRTKIWFPMFGYFEANIYGIVPNEYSNLFSVKNLSWAFYTLATTPWLFILGKVKLTLVALSGVTSRQDISAGLLPPTDGGQTDSTESKDSVEATNDSASVSHNPESWSSLNDGPLNESMNEQSSQSELRKRLNNSEATKRDSNSLNETQTSSL